MIQYSSNLQSQINLEAARDRDSYLLHQIKTIEETSSKLDQKIETEFLIVRLFQTLIKREDLKKQLCSTIEVALLSNVLSTFDLTLDLAKVTITPEYQPLINSWSDAGLVFRDNGTWIATACIENLGYRNRWAITFPDGEIETASAGYLSKAILLGLLELPARQRTGEFIGQKKLWGEDRAA